MYLHRISAPYTIYITRWRNNTRAYSLPGLCKRVSLGNNKQINSSNRYSFILKFHPFVQIPLYQLCTPKEVPHQTPYSSHMLPFLIVLLVHCYYNKKLFYYGYGNAMLWCCAKMAYSRHRLFPDAASGASTELQRSFDGTGAGLLQKWNCAKIGRVVSKRPRLWLRTNLPQSSCCLCTAPHEQNNSLLSHLLIFLLLQKRLPIPMMLPFFYNYGCLPTNLKSLGNFG